MPKNSDKVTTVKPLCIALNNTNRIISQGKTHARPSPRSTQTCQLRTPPDPGGRTRGSACGTTPAGPRSGAGAPSRPTPLARRRATRRATCPCPGPRKESSLHLERMGEKKVFIICIGLCYFFYKESFKGIKWSHVTRLFRFSNEPKSIDVLKNIDKEIDRDVAVTHLYYCIFIIG